MTETLVAQQARARFIVTLPPEPSLVGAELLRLSRASFTTLTDTSDAFLHLARRARERLVIMTPFIDATGAAWAADIFEATTAHHKWCATLPTLKHADRKACVCEKRCSEYTITLFVMRDLMDLLRSRHFMPKLSWRMALPPTLDRRIFSVGREKQTSNVAFCLKAMLFHPSPCSSKRY
jgi:hypothetical protein